MACCRNPTAPGQAITATLLEVPVATDLDQPDQRDAKFTAQGCVSSTSSCDASSWLTENQQQQRTTPIRQGFQPVATLLQRSGGSTAEAHKPVWADHREQLLRGFSDAMVLKSLSKALSQGLAGLPHPLFRQSSCSGQQRDTRGHWLRSCSPLPSDYSKLCPADAVTSFLTAARAEQEKFTPDTRRLRLFSGTSNPGLAREIAAYLGVPDGPRVCKRFADGELYVQIQESIRGCDVFLIQPTCAPVNDHLMELLIMVDACRRASARQITAVVPYYGYARADRKTAGRESITAKLTANLLVKSGVDRVLAMDLHSAQIQGYFDIPCDHIYGSPVLVDYLSTQNLGDIVVVSPDVGGVARARAFAKQMNDAPLAIIDKRRTGHNMAESLTVIGDVAGRTAILIDDMIDTGGTICAGARLLREQGAKRVLACATHAVFSPPAAERLSTDGLFEQVVVTNSIPILQERTFPQLQVLSVANMLGEAIWRIHEESSVSSMFR